MSYVRLLRFVTLILLASWLAVTGGSAASPKPADEAFQLHVFMDDEENLEFSWSIAPGYYLYRSRISATLNGRSIKLLMSGGELKDDPTFGPTQIFHRAVTAKSAAEPLPKAGDVLVTYQGCGEGTVCYPPITKALDLLTLELSDAGDAIRIQRNSGQSGVREEGVPAATDVPAASHDGSNLDLDGTLLPTLLAFLGLGLLLSLTPCVLPMVPILSGILTRSSGEALSAWRGFAISLVYVLAMATAYGSLGVFAAWSGANLQLVLQTPVAVGLTSLILAVLAASMFGLFELQLPQSWNTRLLSGADKAGPFGTAAVLGFGSALIVGPCVTPPLAAALIYVLQTGNAVRGSAALFALGFGMGLPLLAFGTLGARVLPKSGPWLIRVRQAFGFAFLGLAIWMASRLLPLQVAAIGWGIFFISLGAWIGLLGLLDLQTVPGLRKIANVGLGAAVTGSGFFLLLAGAGGLQQPLQTLASVGLISHALEIDPGEGGFRIVVNETDLDAEIADARANRQTVLVDFSAEWCTECKIMERSTFSDPEVRRRLHGLRLLRADVTNVDASRRTLMQRFSVIGPPTLIFLTPDGKEIDQTRAIGNIGVNDLLNRIVRAQQG